MKKKYYNIKNCYFEELKGVRAEQVKEARKITLAKYGLRYLDDVYTNYSTAKAIAEKNITNLENELNGYNYTIHGANSCTFSCSFETKEFIYYFTKNNNYIIAK